MAFHREHHPFNCFYCGVSLVAELCERQITIDHVVPSSKGGSNHISNKVTACRKCNLAKAAADIEDFRSGTFWAESMHAAKLARQRLKPMNANGKQWFYSGKEDGTPARWQEP